MPQGLGWGYFFNMPYPEPAPKRAVAFIDGQNLYYGVKGAFGYTYPNYDALALASSICASKGWSLTQTRFYSGIPDAADDPFWNYFWSGKMAVMGRQGVHVYSRHLRYRNKKVKLPNIKDFGAMAGKDYTFLAAEEKGIDVRLSLDVIRLALNRTYDVALVFSQDQDLSEVADEIRSIAKEQGRWLHIACAYPNSPASVNKRGINKADWIKIDRATYDSCLDTRDYRPPKI